MAKRATIMTAATGAVCFGLAACMPQAPAPVDYPGGNAPQARMPGTQSPGPQASTAQTPPLTTGDGNWRGTRLTQSMISDRLTGRTLHGCYADGTAWSERLNADGSFQDMQAGGARLGQWYATGLDEVCFRYTAGENAGGTPVCYIVSETGDGLHFYEPGTGAYVASTACPMGGY